MRVCSLSSVKNRIGLGALVEAHELADAIQPARSSNAAAQRVERLPGEWDRGAGGVRQELTAPVLQMAGAINSATDLLLSLINETPDLALAQVVRQSENGISHYGISHSIHAATACQAAVRHLGWSKSEQRRAFQAALTMNLGMVDLQARLVTQVSPLTAKQRDAINEHPTRSAEILSQAGITDEEWLDAVSNHHEVSDGSGYPQGAMNVSELAELPRFAYIYTALLSSRASRDGAAPAARAGTGFERRGPRGRVLVACRVGHRASAAREARAAVPLRESPARGHGAPGAERLGSGPRYT